MDMQATPEVARKALEAAFLAQRNAHRADPFPSLQQRRERLERLKAMTEAHGAALAEAISADFGHRSSHETRLAEISLTISTVRHAQRHLARWMKPRRAPTAIQFLPAKNVLMRQPLGVVGIIAPWNYPYLLAMSPAVGALAAGNRVMIKPSEFTPRFSALLAALVAEYFEPSEMTVVTGDMEVGQAFSELPFDHLIFTGSTATGRRVAVAAAKNLTPVTLELGGKSPAIIDPSADLDAAAASLAFGKLLNAGQTCVAPDYILVPEDKRDALVAALKAAAEKMYPRLADNPDYTAIINERHYQRLESLLADAVAGGAQLVPLTQAAGAEVRRAKAVRKFPPTLVMRTTPEMRIMQEEIFGPVLPVVTYRNDIQEAIDYVNGRDRPLALYWYGKDGRNRELVLAKTVSGGVTINDCIWHLCQEEQPFGGVGPSGMGAYHGEWGFRALSKEKPVFHQSRLSGIGLLHPPYGKTFETMLRVLRIIG